MIVENFEMLFDLLYLLCIPYYQLLAQLNPIQTGGGGGAFEALPNFKVK